MLRWKLTKAAHQIAEEAPSTASQRDEGKFSRQQRPKSERPHGYAGSDIARSREPVLLPKGGDLRVAPAPDQSERRIPYRGSKTPPPLLGLGMRIAGDLRVLSAPDRLDGPRPGDELVAVETSAADAPISSFTGAAAPVRRF